MQDITKSIASISLTDSDKLLQSWGYHLAAEYFQVLSNSKLSFHQPILELATGTGRMAAILTRLGYDVVSGDISTVDREKAVMRITKEYLSKVKFQIINMEALPFDDDSFSNVISMNTFHHLENPEICLKELVRVHSGQHSLIIGDFKETGFNELQKVHQILYGNDHPRGILNMVQIKSFLETQYREIKEVHTPLNLTCIALGKKTAEI